MDPALEKLIRLHELESMEEEISSKEYMEVLKKLWSNLSEEELESKRDEALKAIKQEKETLIKALQKLNPSYYSRYKHFKKAYGHGIAQVVNGICLNCFARIPTAYLTRYGELLQCPNCGIFLYVPKNPGETE